MTAESISWSICTKECCRSVGRRTRNLLIFSFFFFFFFFFCELLSSPYVRRPSSTISLLTLSRSQFWSNLDETWSECLPLWNLGQVWYWVTWGQKLGHQVKSKEKFVNPLEVIFLTQSWWNLLKMFASIKSTSSLKLGHLGSKTRSPGQISRKPC